MKTLLEQRLKILSLIEGACRDGARKSVACEALGIDIRTVQRWQKSPLKTDQRKGPGIWKHALSPDEKNKILTVCSSEPYRNLSANQVVPLLADLYR